MCFERVLNSDHRRCTQLKLHRHTKYWVRERRHRLGFHAAGACCFDSSQIGETLLFYGCSAQHWGNRRFIGFHLCKLAGRFFFNPRGCGVRGIGGTQLSLIRGSSCPRSKPLHLYIPFWQKRLLFEISQIENCTAFTDIPTVETLSLFRWGCSRHCTVERRPTTTFLCPERIESPVISTALQPR